jgi:hypothetical protein
MLCDDMGIIDEQQIKELMTKDSFSIVHKGIRLTKVGPGHMIMELAKHPKHKMKIEIEKERLEKLKNAKKERR